MDEREYSSEKQLAPVSPQKSGQVTARLTLAISTAALGMFNFGYNTGVINAPQGVIQAFFNETNYHRTGRGSSEYQLTSLWSTTVAIMAVGGMAGGLLGGWWAERFGRKGGMLINTVFGILAAGLMGFSKLATSYEMLIAGRLIVGFNCGLYTGLSPLYNAEVSPDNVRGAVGTINQLAVTVGMLISQVLGLSEILGNERFWPLLLALTALPPVVQLALLPLLPESPRYLLLTKDRPEEATKALMVLRGASDPTDVSEELDELLQDGRANSTEKQMNIIQVFRTSYLHRPLALTVLMHLSQQLSGIVCIFYYSTSLFTDVGLEEENAKYATLAVGGIMVIMTLVSIPLMDRAGRRTLHLAGLGGMCLMSIAFTVSFSQKENVDWVKYISIISALTIVVFFALGPGSIPWMIVPELFSQAPRSVAVNLGVFVNWSANLTVGQCFPYLQRALKTLVFIPFTVLLAIFFISLFFLLPETKGKPIEEITAMFQRKAGVVDTAKPAAPKPTDPLAADSNPPDYYQSHGITVSKL